MQSKVCFRNKKMKIVLLVFLLVTLYAIFFEIKDCSDSYKDGIPVETDSLKTLTRKIKILFQSQSSSVKWRRAYISAFLCVALLIILSETKTESEIMIIFFVCFFVFFTVSQFHSKFNYSNCELHHDKCINGLKKNFKNKNK